MNQSTSHLECVDSPHASTAFEGNYMQGVSLEVQKGEGFTQLSFVITGSIGEEPWCPDCPECNSCSLSAYAQQLVSISIQVSALVLALLVSWLYW